MNLLLCFLSISVIFKEARSNVQCYVCFEPEGTCDLPLSEMEQMDCPVEEGFTCTHMEYENGTVLWKDCEPTVVEYTFCKDGKARITPKAIKSCCTSNLCNTGNQRDGVSSNLDSILNLNYSHKESSYRYIFLTILILVVAHLILQRRA